MIANACLMLHCRVLPLDGIVSLDPSLFWRTVHWPIQIVGMYFAARIVRSVCPASGPQSGAFDLDQVERFEGA